MSFIYHDYTGPLINNFRMNSTVFQRFKLKWASNETHYNKELVFYENDQVIKDIRMKRFLLSIGLKYSDLESNDYDEVERCWFWLNPDRQYEDATEEAMVNASTDIASVLNSKLTVGDRVRVSLTYGGSTQFYINGHKEEWEINSADEIESLGTNYSEIFEKIHSEPWKYVANIIKEYEDRDTHPFHRYNTGKVDLNSNKTPKGVNSRRSTPATTTTIQRTDSNYNEDSEIEYFALALVDVAYTCFEPTRNVDGTIKVFRAKDTSYIRREEENPDPIFDIDGNLIIYDKKDIKDFSLVGASSARTEQYEFTYKGATENTGLIEAIKAHIPSLGIKDRRENYVMNTLQKQLMNKLYINSVGVKMDNQWRKWHEYFDGDRLIKEKAHLMKRYEFVNMISDCLDTDFRAEDPSMFEKVFAVLIIIVAIVVVIYSVGTAAPGVGAMMALSQGLGYASLVLTVGGMIFSQMGLSAQGLVKMIGKVAQIVGLAASLTGLMASAQAAYKKAAEAAVKEGTIKSTAEYSVKAFAKDMVDDAIDSVMSKVNSVFDALSNPLSLLEGNVIGKLDKLSGFMGNLQNGAAMYNRFMGSSADKETPEEPTEEQMSKTNFQYPEQMFELQEQMVYEPDALERMNTMKENQFGLARTEKLLDQIA